MQHCKIDEETWFNENENGQTHTESQTHTGIHLLTHSLSQSKPKCLFCLYEREYRDEMKRRISKWIVCYSSNVNQLRIFACFFMKRSSFVWLFLAHLFQQQPQNINEMNRTKITERKKLYVNKTKNMMIHTVACFNFWITASARRCQQIVL